MNASELIKLLQEKIDKYWDWEVFIKEKWVDKKIDIYEVIHNWENWIFIYINN